MPKSASLQSYSKDPFASRNAVLLVLVGIREVSASAVRQAVFVARSIVGARMRNKNQVEWLTEFRVVASNPSVKRTRLSARRLPVR